MNSNYVAKITVCSIPNKQLVSVDMYVSEYKLLVLDTFPGDMYSGVNVALVRNKHR